LCVQGQLFVRAFQVQSSRLHRAIIFPIIMNGSYNLPAAFQGEAHMSHMQAMLKDCQRRQNNVVRGFERNLVNRGESGVGLVFTEVVDGAELAPL
jgi:hypothetical protein